MRHPGENPTGEFFASGGLQSELQRTVPALPQLLARVPHPFTDVGGHLAGEEQAHFPGFVGLADAKGVFEEGFRVECGEWHGYCGRSTGVPARNRASGVNGQRDGCWRHKYGLVLHQGRGAIENSGHYSINSNWNCCRGRG